MREIKFKAWDNKNKVMYPTAIIDATGNVVGILEGQKSLFEVGRADIMQYTGLKDKNGKEIYEGDILVDKEYKSSTCKYSVIWKQSICGFIGNGNEGDKYGYFTLNMATNSGAYEKKFKKYVEIIGNIYENPELLK